MELVDRLVNRPDLWTAYPSRKGRSWFVGKLLLAVLPSQLEAKLAQARRIVSPRLEAADPLFRTEWLLATEGDVPTWDAKQDEDLRAEILYGLLGVHPDFFNNIPYLHFVARRRYRIVIRMTRFVDPYTDFEKQGFVFVYPPGDAFAGCQLNTASQLHWEMKNGKYPFVLSAEGKMHPRVAIELLFTGFPKPGGRETDDDGYVLADDDRNMLGCEAVATAVHIDSLLAAKSPDTLLEAMARKSDDYLRIDHPVGSIVYSEAKGYYGVGQLTVARNAQLGDVDLKVEVDETLGMLIANTGPIRAVAGIDPVLEVGTQGANGVLEGFHVRIEDGILPRAEVVITGVYVDLLGVDAGNVASANEFTRFTGWLKVERLPRDIVAGTGLTEPTAPAPHLLNDPRSSDTAFFERVYVSRDDLVPGDHVVLPNHPLYRSIVFEGAWQAEHSFVTRLFDEIDGNSGLRTAGHGLSGKVTDIATSLLNELNKHLALIAQVTRKHLTVDNGLAGRSGREQQCFDLGLTVVDCTSPGAVIRIAISRYYPFKYTAFSRDGVGKRLDPTDYGVVKIHDGTGKVTEYDLRPPGKLAQFENESNPAHPNAKPNALTVRQRTGESRFAFRYEGKQLFVLAPLPTESNNLTNWKLGFVDPKFVLARNHRLFSADLPGLDDAFTRLIEFSDLQGVFPIYNDVSTERIAVIRPRVDFSDEYQRLLANAGAL